MQCKHFGICGGCALQDLPYEEQLALKKQLITKQAYKHKIELPHFQVTPSPKVFFYRNKVELSFSPCGGQICLGFHQRGKNRTVIDVEECFLFSEKLPEILTRLRQFVKDKGLVAYDKYAHSGFWRYCLIRRNRNEEYLLAVITSSQGQIDKEGLISALDDLDYIKGLYWVIHDGLGDAVGFGSVEHLKGRDALTEQVCGVTFLIGLRGFFQINPWSTEMLYQWVLDYVKEHVEGKILDLYAGSGGIGLVLAKQGFDVLGIEMEEGAVLEARQNVLANQIKSYSMLKGNVRALLGINPDWRKKFNCVIVDPPRSGMPPKVRYRVVKLKAEHIVYISCNPVTFMQDLKDMVNLYEIVEFSALDMFPHTPHVEIVAFLRRRR